MRQAARRLLREIHARRIATILGEHNADAIERLPEVWREQKRILGETRITSSYTLDGKPAYDLCIEPLVVFDHDWLGVHMLCQVWDHSQQETADWKYVLIFVGCGGSESWCGAEGEGSRIVYYWPRCEWSKGQVPRMMATLAVEHYLSKKEQMLPSEKWLNL